MRFRKWAPYFCLKMWYHYMDRRFLQHVYYLHVDSKCDRFSITWKTYTSLRFDGKDCSFRSTRSSTRCWRSPSFGKIIGYRKNYRKQVVIPNCLLLDTRMLSGAKKTSQNGSGRAWPTIWYLLLSWFVLCKSSEPQRFVCLSVRASNGAICFFHDALSGMPSIRKAKGSGRSGLERHLCGWRWARPTVSTLRSCSCGSHGCFMTSLGQQPVKSYGFDFQPF